MIKNLQVTPRRLSGLEGVDIAVKAEAVDADCQLITQADVSELQLQVFDDATGEATHNQPLTAAQTIIDDPADRWNFRFVVPGSAIPSAETSYSVWLWCKPVGGGSDFPLWFLVDLTPVKKVAFSE